MKQENKRGGARKGAGRKSIGRTIPKALRFSPEELEKLKKNAEKNGKNMTEWIVERCCG